MKIEQAKKQKNCFAISYAMARQSQVRRRRGSARGHVTGIMADPMFMTAILSLIYLPRAIRLARRPVVPAPAPIQQPALQEPAPAALAELEERRALRAWSAECVGLEESLELLAGYVTDPQAISRGRWRTMSIAKVCGYREELFVLFDKIHDDPELSAFREALHHRLHRQRDADRILRNAWPYVESEAKRYAAIRERRRSHEDHEPREPKDGFRPRM